MPLGSHWLAEKIVIIRPTVGTKTNSFEKHNKKNCCAIDSYEKC